MKTQHVLSFGAGVNSVALMILLLRENMPLDEAIFADTGGEVPETYQYLGIAKEYLAKHGVPLSVVAKKGSSLYDTAWRRQVFPSAIWRWSTRDYKVTPILRHYRASGAHINQYIAIAKDEIHRMKDSQVNYVTNIFPLIDRDITRAGCIEIIQQADLPVPPRSSCYFCPFNSVDRWRWIYDNHPELYEKAIALEENSKHFPSQRLTDQAFRERTDVSLRTLANIFANNGPLPSRPAIDNQQCGGACDT